MTRGLWLNCRLLWKFLAADSLHDNWLGTWLPCYNSSNDLKFRRVAIQVVSQYNCNIKTLRNMHATNKTTYASTYSSHLFHHPSVSGISHSWLQFTQFGSLFLRFKTFSCVLGEFLTSCIASTNVVIYYSCNNNADFLKLECKANATTSIWATRIYSESACGSACCTGPFLGLPSQHCKMRFIFNCKLCNDDILCSWFAAFCACCTKEYELYHRCISLCLFSMISTLFVRLDGNAGIRSGWSSQS